MIGYQFLKLNKYKILYINVRAINPEFTRNMKNLQREFVVNVQFALNLLSLNSNWSIWQYK